LEKPNLLETLWNQRLAKMVRSTCSPPASLAAPISSRTESAISRRT
jgi:hypothetical protein